MAKKLYGMNLKRDFTNRKYDMLIIASNKQEAFEIAQSEYTARRLNPAQLREIFMDRSCILHKS